MVLVNRLHAFDAQNFLKTRKVGARCGTKFKTLDVVERTLNGS